MFKKESYNPTVHTSSVTERTYASVEVVHTVSGLGLEEIVNNAIQLDTKVRKKENKLTFLLPQQFDQYHSYPFNGTIKPQVIKQERIGDEVSPDGKLVELPFRLSKKTEDVLGDKVLSDLDMETALNQYAGVAGHWFLGSEVTIGHLDPVRTNLPRKVPTVREPKYKGRHEKK